MPDTTREKAPAKLNLALHVLGRRADGYHALDSLVAFVPRVADELSLAPAEAFGLHLQGARAEGLPTDERNLALRAAMLLLEHWPEQFSPVRITLRKELPTAAGIGGGSADAAAVIRAMCRLFAFTPPDEELRAVALALGADVPVCLHGKAARMRGIGEEIAPLSLPAGAHVLLVNPGVAVSTAEVFARLRAGPPEEARALPPEALRRPWPDARALAATLATLRNDLEPPARALAPAIGECLQWLRRQPGVLLARMSGSGATCFALFADGNAAQDALRAARRDNPDWWAASGTLL